MNKNNFEKEIYNLSLTNLTPLHIGNGCLLHPNSKLLELKDEELSIKNTAHVSNNSPQEISEFIHTNGKAFIPGSSVKGAIRSAYLYNWLQMPFGKRKLIECLQKVIEIVKHYESLPSQRQNKRAKRQTTSKINQIFDWLIDNLCFGGEKNFSKWNNLRISDSTIDDKNTCIYELRRYYLQTEYHAIPTFVEALEPNQEFTLSLHYVKDQNNRFDNHIGKQANNSFKSPVAIKKTMNNYSLANLEYELKVLTYEDVKNDSISKYESFLKNLQQEIKGNTANNVFYFRLGAGKLQYYQTIAMAVYSSKTDKKMKDAYTAFITNFKQFKEEKLFPKTRVLTLYDQLPLGWVKCEFVNH